MILGAKFNIQNCKMKWSHKIINNIIYESKQEDNSITPKIAQINLGCVRYHKTKV